MSEQTTQMQNVATTRGRSFAREIDERLAAQFPDARCELNYESPWQLLVATVLSAQTTDVRVNQVTPELFSRWPSARDLADANPDEVREVLRPLGFTSRRAAHVISLSKKLVTDFDEAVPQSPQELVTLPGVGRKTAHVVLAEAFDMDYLAVDTHVMRTARRLGLTTHDDPLHVEYDLVAQFAGRKLAQVHHRLIFLGRRICHARAPKCHACSLSDLCPSATDA